MLPDGDLKSRSTLALPSLLHGVRRLYGKTGGLVIGNIVSSRTQEHREDIILKMKCANLWNMRLRSTLRLFLK